MSLMITPKKLTSDPQGIKTLNNPFGIIARQISNPEEEIRNFLRKIERNIFNKTRIIANFSRDDEEFSLTWWDKGTFNSLSIWADDYTSHFSSHNDGTLLDEQRFSSLDQLRNSFKI